MEVDDGFEFDAICVGGGSLQTIAFLPEIISMHNALNGQPINTRIKRFVGCSAGNIFAIAMAAGLPLDQLISLLEGISRQNLFKPSLMGLWTSMGMDDGEALCHALLSEFATRGINLDMPISEFNAKHGVELDMFTVDGFSARGTFVPRHATLLQGIRCSGAIPFVYAPYFFDDTLYFDGEVAYAALKASLDTHTNWLELRVDTQAATANPRASCAHLQLNWGSYLRFVRAAFSVVCPACTAMKHIFVCLCRPDERIPAIIPRVSPHLIKSILDEALERPGRVYAVRRLGDQPT